MTEPKQVDAILRAINDYQGTPIVARALRPSPLVFVHPGDLRAAEWTHSTDASEWRRTVTKTGTPHIVPISTQSAAILRDLQLPTGHGPDEKPGFVVIPFEETRGPMCGKQSGSAHGRQPHVAAISRCWASYEIICDQATQVRAFPPLP